MDALDREFNEMCDGLFPQISWENPYQTAHLPGLARLREFQAAQTPVAVPRDEQAHQVAQLRAFVERLGLAEPAPPRSNAATQNLLAAMQAQWDAERKRPGSWGMP